MPKNKKQTFIHYTTVKHLYPTSDEQTIKIIPREFGVNIAMSLRDDSTNNTYFLFPTNVVKNGNYLDITDNFDLVEGRFYDLKIFYGSFEKRVELDKGILEGLQCLGVDYDANDIIYRDKIFCTSQNTNQIKNEYYTVNKDEYKSLKSDNDFIVL